MTKNTIINYTNGIKAKYEEEKLGYHHEYLNNPSLALLRDFCLSKCNEGLNNLDNDIFRKYFGKEDDLGKLIYNYDTNQFKAIESFLKGRNKKTSIENLNLIAILIDFNPRPFNEFIKQGSKTPVIENNNKLEGIKTDSIIEKNDEKEIESTDAIKKTIINPVHTIEKKINKSWFKKNQIKSSLLLIGIITIGFFAFVFFTNTKNCIQWNKDHYEEVDCNTTNQKMNFALSNPIIKKDQNLYDNFKKITVSDTTTFFNKDGSPKVWYGKSFNGTHECFTMPGLHPETGETLKKISQRIIDKHLLNK